MRSARALNPPVRGKRVCDFVRLTGRNE